MPSGAIRLRERARQRQQADLGDVMGGQLGLGDQLLGIGHAERDDPAPLLRFHDRHDRLGQVKNRMEIVIEHVVPAGVGFLQQRDTVIGAGAVDQGIDAAEFLVHALD